MMDTSLNVSHVISMAALYSTSYSGRRRKKKFSAFYGTRRFITVFTRALHWSLS
jgi:hypothetical protein